MSTKNRSAFIIHCLGISHHTSSVTLRECLAFTPHRRETALARVGCGDDPDWSVIQELVILSTCNRVEIYAVASKPVFDVLEAFLAEIQGVSPDEFVEHSYQLVNEEVVEHLLHVAAGLDSVVLGEPQILGQVTDAYSASRRHGTAGKVLSRLFQAAIYAGKRARTETTISYNPASISSMAVRLIAEAVPELESARVMVLGAGEMAELAFEALRKRGVSDVTVVNRTLNRAKALADNWNGAAAPLEALLDLLPTMDIIITSTGAPHTIISAPMIARAMADRPDRPMVLMDIAVPRDVDAAVGALPNVSLFDMDTLSDQLEVSLARREAEVPAVEAILAEERAIFHDYLATLDVVPVIVGMRNKANQIREAELQKAIRRMPELNLETQEKLELLTKSIVKKILHNPTIRLREVAGSPNAADYANIARGLFGLD